MRCLAILAALLALAITTMAQPIGGVPATSNAAGSEYPRIHPDLTVSFKFLAPAAKQVLLVPKSIDMGPRPMPMVRAADGSWSVTTPPISPGFHYYELRVDGTAMTDPGSRTFFGWGRETSGLEVPDPSLAFYDEHAVPHGTVAAVRYRSSVTDA